MNAADQAIEEIRAVRHRISAEFDHDIAKYLAHLQELEQEYPEQIKRGRELLARLEAERRKDPKKTDGPLALRDKSKS